MQDRAVAAVSPLDADRLVYFDAALEGFARAAAAVGSGNRYFDVGGQIVRLRVAGTVLPPQITRAIAHLETDAVASPALTICAWDSASTATRPPLLLDSFIALLRLRWWELLDGRGEIKGYHGERFRTSFHLGPDILSVLDTSRRLAVYWTEDATAMPNYERASPLRSILSWWGGDNGRQYVHAGAVGTATGGVLLAGRSGVGKSSTVLACLGSELSFASDDYCLVTAAPRPYVYSLYNTAKLRSEEDLARLPHLRPLVNNADRAQDQKLMLVLQERRPDTLIRGFPLKAVLVPRISSGVATGLRETTASAALLALAPSTLFQLSGSGQDALRLMSRLVRQVPCYILDLGTDVSRIPPTISSLLRALS